MTVTMKQYRTAGVHWKLKVFSDLLGEACKGLLIQHMTLGGIILA